MWATVAGVVLRTPYIMLIVCLPVALQMSFRLAGNSNIEIAIEMGAGTHTRLVPKVTDLHVSGTARIILSPLLPEIPGFGAMVFSLKCALSALSIESAPRPVFAKLSKNS